jgi:hypothetical protein
MNMHEWMLANPRPDHPMFDGQAFRALDGRDARQGYMQDFRSQIGDWRDQMQDWRGDRRDYRQSMNGGMMQGQPIPGQQGLPTGEAPQPIQGSGYGFNLADILQRFPNGLGLRNSQPGLNPGY